MKLRHGIILTLFLLGWLWFVPVAPAQAQGPAGPKVLPEILEFDRKFCPICKASELVILAVKDRYPGQFSVRKLYMDEDESWFRRYKVAIVPTQVFLDSSGKEVYRHEGVFKQEEMIQKLRELKFIGE
ncbi:MAG: thioredoxin domain-containing protein [Thermodesulfobacteriota bacterium]